MAQPIDMLVRDVTIDGAPAPDGRLVVTDDGRGVLITNNGTPPQATAAFEQTELGTRDDGRLVVYAGIAGSPAEIVFERDGRCGSCGGRYELSRLDPAPFLPQPEPAE